MENLTEYTKAGIFIVTYFTILAYLAQVRYLNFIKLLKDKEKKGLYDDSLEGSEKPIHRRPVNYRAHTIISLIPIKTNFSDIELSNKAKSYNSIIRLFWSSLFVILVCFILSILYKTN